jgi:hypothetical protein
MSREDITKEFDELTSNKDPRPLRDIDMTRNSSKPISPDSIKPSDDDALSGSD